MKCLRICSKRFFLNSRYHLLGLNRDLHPHLHRLVLHKPIGLGLHRPPLPLRHHSRQLLAEISKSPHNHKHQYYRLGSPLCRRRFRRRKQLTPGLHLRAVQGQRPHLQYLRASEGPAPKVRIRGTDHQR